MNEKGSFPLESEVGLTGLMDIQMFRNAEYFHRKIRCFWRDASIMKPYQGKVNRRKEA